MTSAPPPSAPQSQPPLQTPAARSGFDFGDFLAFRYLITPPLMQVIYVVGAIVVTLAGLLGMFGVANAGGGSVLGGLLIIVFGNLGWRIYMELIMLLFRVNDGIQEVARNTRR